MDFGGIYCGVVDFTNPAAYEWFKDEVVKKHSLDIGIDGWMADFGEYLPTDDLVLYNGESPMKEHNRWPVLWAKCNYDALKETGRLGEMAVFHAGRRNRKPEILHATLGGDQSVDFTIHDGLATVICAALKRGDERMRAESQRYRRYTSLFGNTRTKELFLRWAEMAAFTPVMRTHEGNRPDENFQYYDDTDCMERLARMVDVYTMLAPYMKNSLPKTQREVFPYSARCSYIMK